MTRIHPTDATDAANAAQEAAAAAGGMNGIREGGTSPAAIGASNAAAPPPGGKPPSPPRPPSKPPAPARGPATHSSAPSMSLPNAPPNARAPHTRNVTPHTESLMNLFAKPPPPATTPKTPVLAKPAKPAPRYGAVESNNRSAYGFVARKRGPAGLPLSPGPNANKEGVPRGTPPKQQRQEEDDLALTPRRNNSSEKVPRMRAEDFPALPPMEAAEDERGGFPNIPRRLDLDDTGAAEDDFPQIPKRLDLDREITPIVDNSRWDRKESNSSSHNRDETLVASNSSRKDKSRKEEDERKIIEGILAAHERTGLLETQQPSGDDERAALLQETMTKKGGLKRLLSSCDAESLRPTLVGSVLFSLFQLVFCFAEGSAITRPSLAGTAAASTLLAPMALMACVGGLVSAPMLIAVLGGEHAALYPCLDLFMAPFLGQMAADIDEVLATSQDDGDGGDSTNDTGTFLATFVALNAFGMLLSGLLCVLAGKVKLANLAGFLPYPVLCGFFSSVGISVWICAFKVDTGVTIQRAIATGTRADILVDFARHSPSIAAGAALYVLGPKGPHFIMGIIAATIGFAYLTMALTGTTLEEAQEMSFFWRKEEVMMSPDGREFDYGPPAAFGLWNPAVLGRISWPAFANGLANVVAMSVIYLLKCSLHAAAMYKLKAQRKSMEATESHPLSSAEGDKTTSKSTHPNGSANAAALKMEQGHERKPKQKPRDLLIWYANSLFSSALVGGFAVLPAMAIGGIFLKIGAEKRAPQYLAVLLLVGCYLSDFWICSYVPKCTFSSLLVMAAIDLMHAYFVKSHRKSATEWAVVPIIVVTSLRWGMLQSIGLGLGASTLIFVASFYRAGVVKFIANGLTIRSTIERTGEDNRWLHENADLIQLLVLQNYLFFGNASSCLNYIRSMFDDEAGFDPDLPPVPKHVILDLSIVTGIDTSAVDVLAEISSLCKENKCNLILAGIPRVIRPALITGGVKPSRKDKHLSYCPDLDSALGKAEDELLKFVGHNEEKAAETGAQLRHRRRVSRIDHGLRHALSEIDEQHGISLGIHLQALEDYTAPIEINAGDRLNDAHREQHGLLRGLYFVEAGMLRCDHDSSQSLTRGGTRSGFFAAPHMPSGVDSIGKINARSATVGRTANLLKRNPRGAARALGQDHAFRLARIGPGWVIGSISDSLGQDIPGTYTALTPCRVHHLSFETLEELEVDSPVLILHLYKLLSHLSARRQEMTIGQLATMRSIFSSTAPTKPISRRKMVELCAFKTP